VEKSISRVQDVADRGAPFQRLEEPKELLPGEFQVESQACSSSASKDTLIFVPRRGKSCD